MAHSKATMKSNGSKESICFRTSHIGNLSHKGLPIQAIPKV